MIEIERMWSDPAIEKSEWGDGPWQREPDRMEWIASGLPARIRRNPIYGTLCGYVGVPPEHPMHGIRHSDLEYGALRAHRGITGASHFPSFPRYGGSASTAATAAT